MYPDGGQGGVWQRECLPLIHLSLHTHTQPHVGAYGRAVLPISRVAGPSVEGENILSTVIAMVSFRLSDCDMQEKNHRDPVLTCKHM